MALQTANQFQLVPELSRAGTGFAQGQQIRGQFDVRQRQKEQAEKQQQLQQLSGQALGGQEGALQDVAAIDPQRASQIQSFLAGMSEAERTEGLRENEVLTRTALDALSLPPAERRNFLAGKREEFRVQGRDTSNIDGALAGNDAQLNQALTLQAREGQSVADLAKQQFAQPETAKFQRAGEGLVFNPNTGTFSVDPVAKQRLEETAQKAKNQGGLGFKDRQGLNKDVTSMIKSTVEIKNTAKDLEKLGEIKSGPASIALVFKFMKALDPTSVVREGEFALAEQSAGIPENVRNIYNKLIEGERLGDVQIDQFIEAAQKLSNSATESSKAEVTSMLNAFEGTIPNSFKESLIERVPKPFEVKEEVKEEVKAPKTQTIGRFQVEFE